MNFIRQQKCDRQQHDVSGERVKQRASFFTNGRRIRCQNVTMSSAKCLHSMILPYCIRNDYFGHIPILKLILISFKNQGV